MRKTSALIGLVLAELRERLAHDNASALAAQLPRGLRRLWDARAEGTPAGVRVELLGRVLEHLRLTSADEAERAIIAVLRLVQVALAPVPRAPVSVAGLPDDLAFLWAAAARQCAHAGRPRVA